MRGAFTCLKSHDIVVKTYQQPSQSMALGDTQNRCPSTSLHSSGCAMLQEPDRPSRWQLGLPSSRGGHVWGEWHYSQCLFLGRQHRAHHQQFDRELYCQEAGCQRDCQSVRRQRQSAHCKLPCLYYSIRWLVGLWGQSQRVSQLHPLPVTNLPSPPPPHPFLRKKRLRC